MRWRRLVYFSGLLASIFYYIFHSGYFSWFLLLLFAAFLPLELLLTLPIYLTTRVELQNNSHEVACGEEFALQVPTHAPIPVCTVKAKLYCQNLFSRTTTKQKLLLKPREVEIPQITQRAENCGLIQCRLAKLRMLDLAGLFALPLRTGRPVQVLARPAPLPAAPTLSPTGSWHQSPSERTTSRPAPGSMREFSDIREFREGDSQRDIHWKLSAKLDKLIVRELSSPSTQMIRLGFDCFGSPQDVCQTLARLESLSMALWYHERHHEIHWVSQDNVLVQRRVTAKADFDKFLLELLALPLPAQAKENPATVSSLQGRLLLVAAGTVSLLENGKVLEVLT